MVQADREMMLAIRSLYRRGYKRLTISEMQRRLSREGCFCSWNQSECLPWVDEVRRVSTMYKKRLGRFNGWQPWNFADRFRKAITRLAKMGYIHVKGEKTPRGVYRMKSVVYLWDYTNSHIFGKDRLTFEVV